MATAAASAQARQSVAGSPRASGTGRAQSDGIPVWGDNEMRIRNIQSWLGPSAPQLWREGRVLVGEGILAKQCRKGTKPRQFYLFNDLIVYASIIAIRRQYASVRVLQLNEVEVSTDEDPKCLIIRHPVRSFRVYAATTDEASDWITHIQMCIKALPPSPEPRRPFAALWVPDSQSNVCMACGVQRFSAFRRRHHCRKCGILVCNKCSAYKAMLPRHVFSGPPQSAPQRVCHSCYQQLNATPEPQSQIETPPPKPPAPQSAPTVVVRQVIDESSSEEEVTTVTLRPTGAPLFRENVRSSIFFFDDELDDGRKASTIA